MRDFISLFISIAIFVLCITLFVQLLPFLIIILIIFMVLRHFRVKKQIKEANEYYESVNPYETTGTIKSDVIDVEYEETVEK